MVLTICWRLRTALGFGPAVCKIPVGVADGVNPAPTKPVYLFALTQPFTVAPPTSISRHLRFCRVCYRRGKPRPYNARLFIRSNPTFYGWTAHVYLSTSAVLLGLLRAGVNPAPTMPCVSIHYQTSVGAGLVPARLFGFIRMLGRGPLQFLPNLYLQIKSPVRTGLY